MENNQNQEQSKKWGQLVAKCWADEAMKARFLADPAAVMQEFGLEVPKGRTLKAVANTATESYIVLPEKPSDLADEQLDGVAGGACGPACAPGCSGRERRPVYV